jgi:hypothetical protein
VHDNDPVVSGFGKRDAKYNLPDTSEVNACHCCVWQGLPGRLHKSDLGDIESAGCGPLSPYLMTSSRHADYLRVHVPLSHQTSQDSIDIPFSYLLKETYVIEVLRIIHDRLLKLSIESFSIPKFMRSVISDKKKLNFIYSVAVQWLTLLLRMRDIPG